MANLIRNQFISLISSVSRGRAKGDRIGPLPHAGFVVSWGDRSDADDQDTLNRLADRLFKGAEGSGTAFQDAISYTLANLGNSEDAASIRQFLSGLSSLDMADRQLDAGMRDRMMQLLKINKDEIAQWYVPGEAAIHIWRGLRSASVLNSFSATSLLATSGGASLQC